MVVNFTRIVIEEVECRVLKAVTSDTGGVHNPRWRSLRPTDGPAVDWVPMFGLIVRKWAPP